MGEGLLQPMHLLVIFAIAVLVFGPKKLPELGRGLGQAIRGFKDSLKEGASAADSPSQEREALPSRPAPGSGSEEPKA